MKKKPVRLLIKSSMINQRRATQIGGAQEMWTVGEMRDSGLKIDCREKGKQVLCSPVFQEAEAQEPCKLSQTGFCRRGKYKGKSRRRVGRKRKRADNVGQEQPAAKMILAVKHREESILASCHMGPRDWTQVDRFSGKSISFMIYFTGTSGIFRKTKYS